MGGGGGIRADWHVEDLDAAGDAAVQIAELQSDATLVDLSRSRDELMADLGVLLDKEAAYSRRATNEHGRPLECHLKWQPNHLLMSEQGTFGCYGCPHYTADRRQAVSLICTLGRQQEDLVEMLRGVKIADGLEAEMAAAHSRDIDACAELAEARDLAPA